MNTIFSYTIAIRTLGKAGDKYQQLLNSLKQQTIAPEKILIYIAEGYPLPQETIGIEQYIYVKKGMVAQRALQYNEITTEYILFLDDDLYLPPTAVESMYRLLKENQADIISPDVFPNAERSFKGKVFMALSGRMLPHRDDGKWGYKVMPNAGYSYNNHPKKSVYLSQTNAGACLFCSKNNFLKIHFEEELWLDYLKYALGDDQAMFYKMHLKGLKQLTWFNSGIRHLDADSTINNIDKERTLIYADLRFKIIFWHRFIYLPETSKLLRLWSVLCLLYTFFFTFIVSTIKGKFEIVSLKWKAMKEGIHFIQSPQYHSIPTIKRIKP